MIFNPSAQIYSNAVSVPLKYVVGGHHYIYITRQDYDGCGNIGQLLRNGASTLQRIKPMAAITWTAIPVLSKKSQLLSLANGLIPNDLIVKLRVDNPYGQSRIMDLNRERECTIDGKDPVYEFEFMEVNNFADSHPITALSKVSLHPNPVQLVSDGFTIVLSNVPEGAEIRLMDFRGNVVEVFDEKTTSDTTGG
ncbi:MAG: hypothetical protein IPM26_12795 [Saprospiraceae bacterium]|nr:hypothetical protein [Saprospiraceae bacterium]